MLDAEAGEVPQFHEVRLCWVLFRQPVQRLAGNICRCGTFGRVIEAVQKTARGEIKNGRLVR